MTAWPLVGLLGVFVAAGAIVWVAGVKLSGATDVLATRLGLGEAIGGLVLLALATNLPEIAITTSAALDHDLGIAVGNILGGIAIQTVVLALLDALGDQGDPPLSYMAASLVIVLEAAGVVAVLVLAVMGSQLPSSATAYRLTPGSIAIALAWVASLWLLSRVQSDLPWHAAGEAPGGQEKPRGHAAKQHEASAASDGLSTSRAATTFAVAALATLVGGVALEKSGEGIAGHLHMTGVLFGATLLAAATSLPEVSTGLTSVRLGDYKLAFSDIFGGNTFLPVLFLLAVLVSGEAVLPQAHATDIYLTGLGALLTAIYIWGLITRPRRRILRMGVDSLVVVVTYLVGLGGLAIIATR